MRAKVFIRIICYLLLLLLLLQAEIADRINRIIECVVHPGGVCRVLSPVTSSLPPPPDEQSTAPPSPEAATEKTAAAAATGETGHETEGDTEQQQQL